MQRIKQVILVRKDLRMRRGKEIAQGSHASMEFLASQLRPRLEGDLPSSVIVELSPVVKAWLSRGTAKVCLRVNGEEELIAHHEQALEAGLVSCLIEDSGRTEFGGTPTYTACAIGPDFVDRIDPITRELVPY